MGIYKNLENMKKNMYQSGTVSYVCNFFVKTIYKARLLWYIKKERVIIKGGQINDTSRRKLYKNM